MDFDYQKMVQHAFLNVVKEILGEVAQNGLSEPHHFYITFQTDATNVILPTFLKEQYPTEMTIILQHQFQNLIVEDESFCVDLSFHGEFHNLHIPYMALISFVDPSSQFALQFSPSLYQKKADKTPDTEKVQQEAEIIDFDSIRKKK